MLALEEIGEIAILFLFVFYQVIIFAAKISVVGFQSHSVALWI